MLLSRAMIPPAVIMSSFLVTIPQGVLCVNSVFPERITLVFFTTSAVPRLSWKEQLASSAYCVDCKCRATKVQSRVIGYLLLQYVKAKECILNSTILVKLRPTNPLQTTVGMLPEEDSPRMVSLATLATVIFISRAWSPGMNTIVVLEAKYSSASCAYSESMVQLAEL